MVTAQVHDGSDAVRKRDEDANAPTRWSYKGERLKTIQYTQDCLENGEKIVRGVVDISDVQFPHFTTVDHAFIQKFRRDPSAEVLGKILLERRLEELRNLNIFINILRREYSDLVDIVCVYDHASHRRKGKSNALNARQITTVKKELIQQWRIAAAEYRKKKKQGEEVAVPQIDLADSEDRIVLPAFSPPRDDEVNDSLDPETIAGQISIEAGKLLSGATHIVSTSEADSVCAQASAGVYYEPDAPRSTTPPPHPPPPQLPVGVESIHYSPDRRPAWLPTFVSMILGKDSDHLVLNDHQSARFIVGIARNYACRATDLRRRKDHPSDWKFRDRFAQTLAAALIGCDESSGLPGFSVPGVARANRDVKKPSRRLLLERQIFEFTQEYDQLIQLYESIHGTKNTVETSYLALGSESRDVTWDELERDFRRWINSLLKPTLQEKHTMRLEDVVGVYKGLVEMQGDLMGKSDARIAVGKPLQELFNKQIAILFETQGRNHPFKSLLPPSSKPNPRRGDRAPQPQEHLPYRTVKGPDARKLLDDQLLESNRLVNAQSSAHTARQPGNSKTRSRKGKEKAVEPSKPPSRPPPKSKQTTGKGKKVDQPKESSRKAAVKVGFGQFGLAKSTISFPFQVNTIRDHQFASIPKGHRFNQDFIAVLESILRVWLNECPPITEFVASILAFYWEFAPSVLYEWSSKPREFGDRTAVAVLALNRFYKRFPLSVQLPTSNRPQSLLFPAWLEKPVAKFESQVPEDRRILFRQRIAEADFCEEELEAIFKGDNKFLDIAIAIMIKKRRELNYPRPLIKLQNLLALNFTTCGTGFKVATDARMKSLLSFVANNIFDTLLSMPERTLTNPFGVNNDRVARAYHQLHQLPQSTLSNLLPSINSKKTLRLVKLRIQTAALPKRPQPQPPTTSSANQPTPPADRNRGKEGTEDDNEEDDGDTTMRLGEDEDNEDDEFDGFEVDDEPATEEERLIAMNQRLFEDKLEQEIVATAQKRTSSGTSVEIGMGTKAIVELLSSLVDFMIKFIGQSYLESLGEVGGKEYDTIGDLVVAVGGNILKFERTEKFMEVGSKDVKESDEREEVEQKEEEEDDEDDNSRASPSQKIARRIVHRILPLIDLPFIQMKPRGCTLKLRMIFAFTKSYGGNEQYLPDLVQELLGRIALESEVFNTYCLSLGITFEPLDIKDDAFLETLKPNDPIRIAQEELRRLANSNKFWKDQMANPNKILSFINNCWSFLPLLDKPSNGPLVVRFPTDESKKILEDQSTTVHNLFRHLGLTNQDDIDQVPHEVLRHIFNPSIGVHLYHGQIWFDGFSIHSLVYDPRFFTMTGSIKFEDQVKGKNWREGIEELGSSFDKMTDVYLKMERARGQAGGGIKVAKDDKLETLTPLFDLVEFGQSVGGDARAAAEGGNGRHQSQDRESGGGGRADDANETTKKLRRPNKLRFHDKGTASQAIILDPRKGLHLPFRTPFSETGKKTKEEWKDWVSENLYGGSPPSSTSATSSHPQLPHPSSTTPLFTPTPSTSRTLSNAVASSSSTSSSSYPFASTSSSAAPFVQSPSTPASSNPTDALPPPAPGKAPGSSSFDWSKVDPDLMPGQEQDDQGVVRKLSAIVAVDEGRRVLFDGAVIRNTKGPIDFIRIPSGPSIKADKEAQARLKEITPFEARSRLAKGFQVVGQGHSRTTDLSLLLRRPRRSDPVTGHLLPLDRIHFESERLLLPIPLQAGIIHSPDFLHSYFNNREKERRRRKLDSQATKRWMKLFPKPPNGDEIKVAFVLPYGNISGGKGYGRQASRGVVEAEIRALKAIPWINLQLVRSIESFTSKVCSKPGCGASLVHPGRSTDLSDILRIVVCCRCFDVKHRDDNAALNTARISLGAAQGVEGNLLSPSNAEYLGYTFRGKNSEVTRLKDALKKELSPLSEEDRRRRLENLKKGDNLLGLVGILLRPEEDEIIEMETDDAVDEGQGEAEGRGEGFIVAELDLDDEDRQLFAWV